MREPTYLRSVTIPPLGRGEKMAVVIVAVDDCEAQLKYELPWEVPQDCSVVAMGLKLIASDEAQRSRESAPAPQTSPGPQAPDLPDHLL